MTTAEASVVGATITVRKPPAERSYFSKAFQGAILGPVVGLALWVAPLPLPPAAHQALAVVAFMIVYWVTEPLDHGLTALVGCFLFWSLGIVKFEVAFSGFSNDTPWFLFGAILMGEAAARSGLAKRIGFLITRRIGTSYPRLLIGIITFVFALNFLVPSGVAQLSTVAPLVIGIIAAFGAGPRSNIAKGLFIILTYTCGLFNKMILAGGSSILTRGIIERLTGSPVYWSQYFLAYLPAVLITLLASWLIILWLYPPEKDEMPGGQQYLQDALKEMGRWSSAEKKSLAWLILAVALWMTDFLHHVKPGVIALGVGLAFTLPGLGVLKAKEVQRLNFLLILFMGGALSMSNVLVETKTLDLMGGAMTAWMSPLLGSSFLSTGVLYWTAFLYHFLLASELSMLSTSLPFILNFATAEGFNPLVFGMIWNFASGGKIFVYQSAVLILGYSYGYFEGKDLLKVGLLLTIIEGLVLMILVPFYWPLIGVNWLQ